MERDRRGQRIVVLGGGGVLGAHVSERLVAEGAAVVAADSWVTGRERNLEPIEGPGTLEVVTADAGEIEVGGACPPSPPRWGSSLRPRRSCTSQARPVPPTTSGPRPKRSNPAPSRRWTRS